jgi:hypothetical protein
VSKFAFGYRSSSRIFALLQVKRSTKLPDKVIDAAMIQAVQIAEKIAPSLCMRRRAAPTA